MSQPREVPSVSKAEVYRIVLAPNPGTLWTELGIMSRRIEEEARAEGRDDVVGWTEEEALEIEAVILVRFLIISFAFLSLILILRRLLLQNRTAAPLCLSPSMQTSRIANSMLRATTLRPPKRKRFCSTGDCDDEGEAQEGGEEGQKEREEHEKLMKVGDEGVPRTKGPACVFVFFLPLSDDADRFSPSTVPSFVSFSRLAFIQAYRERQQNPTLAAQPGSSATSIRLGGGNTSGAATTTKPSRAGSPAASTTSGRYKKKAVGAGDHGSDSGSVAGSTVGGGAKKSAAQLKKEKKKREQQQKRMSIAGDLQVGTPGSSGVGTPR